MATVIICTTCGTRYETAAVIPPGGRKVRCSKCGNIWQATAVIEAPAKPSVAPVPRPLAAEPRPAPPAAKAAMGGFPGAQQQPSDRMTSGDAPPPAARTIASFNADEEFQADFDEGGNGAAAKPAWPDAGAPGAGNALAKGSGNFQAGALVNPAAGMATNVPISGKGRKPKVRPVVAIGWGVLALLLIILGAMMALAPKTVVSVLPGAARVYAMLGTTVSQPAVDLQDVRYAWSDAEGQRVLVVQGNVVNKTSDNVTPPAVVIALQDEKGQEISKVTTQVPPLSGGGRAPFAVDVLSPPDTVRSLKVRFAEAN